MLQGAYVSIFSNSYRNNIFKITSAVLLFVDATYRNMLLVALDAGVSHANLDLGEVDVAPPTHAQPTANAQPTTSVGI